ncbi:SGNH/GDSL hydrolase family protein [Bacillus massiliglaciei]|uniref:SGNH/GDSL hydrolase family protein n=1 Tax=Bacillus massiliglaciei TaxID=1816693 RepID=UPI000A673B08|nr:SGNH/GDSL hydrolase family protein [Bacillus massiliglaciei]
MNNKITCLFLCFICVIGSAGCSNGEMISGGTDQTGRNLSLEEKQDVPATFFPDPIQIVSIGDSLTQGVGDSTDTGGYIPYLKKDLEKEPTITSVNITNFGVKGNRTDQLLARLESPEIQSEIKKADSVVVTIGGNDIMKVLKQNFSNLKLEQFESARIGYEQRLRQILDKIRSINENTQIYLIGVYNPFSKWFADVRELDMIMGDWNKAGKQIISDYDRAYFIEIEDIFKNSNEDLLYTEDYFHPNDRGYELIARRIYNNMEINHLGDEILEATAERDDRNE